MKRLYLGRLIKSLPQKKKNTKKVLTNETKDDIINIQGKGKTYQTK